MSRGALRRREDLVVADLKDGEETAFLDPKTGQVVSLNPTAAAIWYLCDGRRDAGAIAREVAQAFPDRDQASIQADVSRALDDLAARGLIG